ncbi:hypothetical protein INT48_004909 [Thamnidium elegans]|uniref:Uncharacterized protein n=1 Tax=Thamnidium elegans TaxID=101142 RepID=A0A8H7VSD2_9FUNG|nr:hypothetical protein INT48_004909 [Thamnidium elegans]
MPLDKVQVSVPIKEINKEQTNEEDIPEDCLDTNFDEELEHAYQCDFTKRAPPPCQNTSLLSDLLSCSVPVKQSNTKRDYSAAIATKPTTSTAVVSEEQLSESLKRNLAREHSQSSLRKYKNIKTSSSFNSMTDNFSKY